MCWQIRRTKLSSEGKKDAVDSSQGEKVGGLLREKALVIALRDIEAEIKLETGCPAHCVVHVGNWE
jgi:hypothetical protein